MKINNKNKRREMMKKLQKFLNKNRKLMNIKLIYAKIKIANNALINQNFSNIYYF